MSTHVVAFDNAKPSETEAADVENDYVLICDGTCYLAHTQASANGTHVITIKGVKLPAKQEGT